ncbi:MAG TPA: hypothetical protein VFO19_17960, partial [Vicinamibacterales bacterium]|nr:hypothetical protein [Vicinamibacterales bacterium]
MQRQQAVRFAIDLRYAARSFARTPGVAAILILTIAAGVGGNTAIFAFIGGLGRTTIVSADPDAASRFARVTVLLVGASGLVLFLACST